MGKASRDKGQRGEREFAKVTEGLRVPLSGAQEGYTNDVKLKNGWEVEVKREKSGLKKVYDILEDEREQPDMMAFRADRKQWVVCMTLDKFKDLMGEGE